MKFIEQVYCRLQVEGTHSWPNCPFDEVAYLRDRHRHVFHIKAYKQVTHSDRDVEFIMLKHEIKNYLEARYYSYDISNGNTITQGTHLHEFGSMSCEMIAKELIEQFDLSACEVNEDDENGAFVEVAK